MRTIEQIKADYDRAVAAGDPTWITFWDGEVRLATARGISQSRLEEICDAERDGRCVVLPCKVGDALWYISDGKVKNAELKAIRINISKEMNGVLFEGIIPLGAYVYSWVIGQMLYLTREEAEAALRKEQSDER